MTHTFHRQAMALAAAALLAACGGSGTETANEVDKPLAAQGRKQALAVPQGVTIPPDASTKGDFGPVQSWPLIPLHVVLRPDGRVMSYGTKGDGTQTAFFIYNLRDPVANSHLTPPNGAGTDTFSSSQLLLPGGTGIVINGGDNWTGHGPSTDTSSGTSPNAGDRITTTREYHHGAGGAQIRLQWRTLGTSTFVAVPASRLNSQ